MNQNGIIYFPLQCLNFDYSWVPIIIPDNQILFTAPGEVLKEVQVQKSQVYGQQNTLNMSIDEEERMIMRKRTQITSIETVSHEKLQNIKQVSRKQRRPSINADNSFQNKRKQSESLKLSIQNQEKNSAINFNQAGKTSWTEEQQEKLKQMVNLFGKRWKYISEHFPNRTGKQIRQRYLNYLKPNLSKNKWTEEEDLEILNLVSRYGRSWRTLEKKLKNRSQNQIKNRYYGHLHKNQKQKNETGKDGKIQNYQLSSAKTSTHLGTVEDTAK